MEKGDIMVLLIAFVITVALSQLGALGKSMLFIYLGSILGAVILRMIIERLRSSSR